MIRSVVPADMAALAAINQACLPAVSSETVDSLAALLALGECWVAQGADGRPQGFLSLLETGTQGYPSDNFDWFETRGGDFVYVDRITLAPSARGRGIGAALYAHAFAHWTGRRASICCEVNTTPPNPGSLRFHKRLGFEVVGSSAYDPGRYEVAFLERRL